MLFSTQRMTSGRAYCGCIFFFLIAQIYVFLTLMILPNHRASADIYQSFTKNTVTHTWFMKYSIYSDLPKLTAKANIPAGRDLLLHFREITIQLLSIKSRKPQKITYLDTLREKSPIAIFLLNTEKTIYLHKERFSYCIFCCL